MICVWLCCCCLKMARGKCVLACDNMDALILAEIEEAFDELDYFEIWTMPIIQLGGPPLPQPTPRPPSPSLDVAGCALPVS